MGKSESMGRVEDAITIDYNSFRRSHESVSVPFMKLKKQQQHKQTTNDLHLKETCIFPMSIHIKITKGECLF